MALVLTVNSAQWNRHVNALAATIDGLVPVVKGNGYGFSRDWLAEKASKLAPVMAVGTVHEVPSVPSNYTAVVLTPALDVPSELRHDAVLTIGSTTHIDAAVRSNGRTPRQVLVKIRSSMNRYGVPADEANTLIQLCNSRGLQVVGVSIHPPLVGTSQDHASEITSLLSTISDAMPAWVSHISPSDFSILQNQQSQRSWFLRLGTSLWHGDKGALKLTADVLDVVAVKKGQIVGYHGATIPDDGQMVMVGCGSAHGVAPLSDGRSPFHFSQQRLHLIEAPHMHTSLCFVPHGAPTPVIGDDVDVQRPLISTLVDRINWV